jgi:hypothetical protein
MRAQHDELRALDFRQRFEIKELKASQAARRREWENRESAAFHEFLKQGKKGPEIREYTKDRKARHSAFLQLLNEEIAQRSQNHQVHYNSVRMDQEARFKEFENYVNRGEQPPQRLWPRPGG